MIPVKNKRDYIINVWLIFLPGKMKKANKRRDNPNFLLTPALRKTAKGGKTRQTSATTLLSSKSLLTWTGKIVLSWLTGWEVTEGRKGPCWLWRIEGENSGELSVDFIVILDEMY